jgi:hypothetical protein
VDISRHLLYKYDGKLRKLLWRSYYSLQSLVIAQSTIAQNSGFGLVSKNGESLNDLELRLSERDLKNLF